MNYDSFREWLKTEKSMSERSARDTVSRLKRALRIISEESITALSTDKLNEAAEFNRLSMFIKSQLRRAIILYQEFDREP